MANGLKSTGVDLLKSNPEFLKNFQAITMESILRDDHREGHRLVEVTFFGNDLTNNYSKLKMKVNRNLRLNDCLKYVLEQLGFDVTVLSGSFGDVTINGTK